MNNDPLRNFIRTMDDARFSLVKRTDAQKLEIIRNLARAALAAEKVAQPEPVAWRIQMPNGALVAWAETALTRDSYIRDGFLSQPYTAAHQPSPTAQSGEGPVDSITVRNSALEEAAKRVENQFGLGTVADDIRSMKLISASTEDMKIYQAIADNYTAPQPSQPVEADLAAQEAGFADFQSALNWIAGHQCDCCEPVPSAVVRDDERAAIPLAWQSTFDGLLAYALQDDLHNRLTPRVIDIAYTAFMSGAAGKNKDDGGPCDWFNDTKPVVQNAIAKLSKALSEARAAPPQATATQPARTTRHGRTS